MGVGMGWQRLDAVPPCYLGCLALAEQRSSPYGPATTPVPDGGTGGAGPGKSEAGVRSYGIGHGFGGH